MRILSPLHHPRLAGLRAGTKERMVQVAAYRSSGAVGIGVAVAFSVWYVGPRVVNDIFERLGLSIDTWQLPFAAGAALQIMCFWVVPILVAWSSYWLVRRWGLWRALDCVPLPSSCKACGYDLVGLTRKDGPCPECGGSIDTSPPTA